MRIFRPFGFGVVKTMLLEVAADPSLNPLKIRV